MSDSYEETTAEDNVGFRVAAIFVGLLIVAAILFTLYFLLWDGGGTSS